jgi:hypothetical protein
MPTRDALHAKKVAARKRLKHERKKKLMALSATQQAEIEDQVYKVLSGTKIKLGRDDIIPPIADELKEMISKIIDPLPPEKKVIIKAAMTPDSPNESAVMLHLKKYNSPGRNMKPTMLIGDQGSGKTTAAKMFAVTSGFDEVIFFNGDEGVDAQSLKGGIRPFPAGDGSTTTIYQYGALAWAVYCASQGKKTMFYCDEFYRIKVRERSPFIGVLSPFRMPDGIEYYQLMTDRILEVKDGIATKVETLMAPRHMLSIVGSTNVGAGFDVQSGDPAEAGRWLQFDLQTTEESVKRIVANVLKDFGFSISLTPKFVKLLNEGKKLKADNFLMLEPDVRILCDGIKLATNEMDIGNALFDAALVWVGRNLHGHREQEQLDQLRNLIARHFPIKPKKVS